jgi:DNA-directed RNA polymerase subunit K/omega
VTSDPVFRAQQVIPNRFLLSVLTFERAKQLIRGARPRGERRYAHPVTTAVDEVASRHVVRTDEDSDVNWRLA